jgi:hypothetical protein
VALVLDPWLPPAPGEQDAGLLELAVSLTATAVADLTSRGHSRLVVGAAADEPQCWSGPASAMFCHEVLAELAVLPAGDGRTIEDTIRRAQEQAPGGARLIVISPRPARVPADPERDNLIWIDVSQPGLAALFALE